MEPIKVVLIDNEEVFREGVAKLLTEQPHIQIVYQGGVSKDDIAKSKEQQPDVILMSSHPAERNSFETVKEISDSVPRAKVVMISRPESGENPIDALKAGARAFLSKSISAVDLVKSIELISSGRIIVSPVFADKFIDEITRRNLSEGEADIPVEFIRDYRVTTASISTQKSADEIIGRKTRENIPGSKAVLEISDREVEVVKLVVQGYSNKEIAQRLYIAENTVKVHVKNILNKLDLKNRQHLAAYAVLQGWVLTDVDGEENKTDTLE